MGKRGVYKGKHEGNRQENSNDVIFYSRLNPFSDLEIAMPSQYTGNQGAFRKALLCPNCARQGQDFKRQNLLSKSNISKRFQTKPKINEKSLQIQHVEIISFLNFHSRGLKIPVSAVRFCVSAPEKGNNEKGLTQQYKKELTPFLLRFAYQLLGSWILIRFCSERRNRHF